MTSPYNVQDLPLEVLRCILSFCSDADIITVCSLVSKRFYYAARDRELLRSCFIRKLCCYEQSIQDRSVKYGTCISLYDDSKAEASLSLINQKVVKASRSHPNGPMFWVRWLWGVTRIKHSSMRNVDDFSSFLEEMEYLPHFFLVGFPIPGDYIKRKWLLRFLAYNFFDVSGPPAFRSRLYWKVMDVHEQHLRTCLCLTVLVLQRKSTDEIFLRDPGMGEQSIAMWLEGSIVSSRDYLWSKGSTDIPAKRHTTIQVEALITIMGIALGVCFRFGYRQFIFPDVAKLPFFASPDMSRYPMPRDVLINPRRIDRGDVPRSFTELISAQQTQFLEADAISQDTWYGYYLLERPYDLTTISLGPILRKIQFHSKRISSQKWEIHSDVFKNAQQPTQFFGYMEGDGGYFNIYLDRTLGGLQERWHGQFSPFGIAGGYSVHTATDGNVISGGLFWLFKEAWINHDHVLESLPH